MEWIFYNNISHIHRHERDSIESIRKVIIDGPEISDITPHKNSLSRAEDAPFVGDMLEIEYRGFIE